jgi:hypothetical protein
MISCFDFEPVTEITLGYGLSAVSGTVKNGFVPSIPDLIERRRRRRRQQRGHGVQFR